MAAVVELLVWQKIVDQPLSVVEKEALFPWKPLHGKQPHVVHL